MPLKNYTRLALINTNQYKIERYWDYTREKAEEFGLRFEEIDGSTSLIEKNAPRALEREFVVVEPGNMVIYADFLN